MKTYKQYIPTFLQLLKADLTAFMPLYKSKVINLSIYMIIVLLTATYLLPGLGVQSHLGPFTAVTLGVLGGMMEVYANAIEFIIDIEGNKVILYQMTLPLPSSLVFLKNVLYYFSISMMTSAVTTPLALLLVSNKLDWQAFSAPKYVLIVIVGCLFFAVFSLFCSSIIGGVRTLSNLWMRLIFPLWFAGCFQFSWQTLNQVNPVFSYIVFLNPFMYVMECGRAAALGQDGSLPYWSCIGIISMFTVIMWIIGTKRLKQKLDCL